MEEEKKILMEIDCLHTELLNESNEKWNGRYMEEANGRNYRRNADKLLEIVCFLQKKFNPGYLSAYNIDAFLHTCNKEVSTVEYYYEKSIKKNAAKIRKKELISAINEANRQINSDLNPLFLRITEIKSEPSFDYKTPTEIE